MYELTRGSFGSIAECAIMITQLDPMINACKSTYYQEKEETIELAKPSNRKRGSSIEPSQNNKNEVNIKVDIF